MQHDECGLVSEKNVGLPLEHDKEVPLAEVPPFHYHLPEDYDADSRLVETDNHAIGSLLDPEYLCSSGKLLQLGGSEIFEVFVVVPERLEEGGLGK
jgi:hypothetical protein